MPDVVLGRNNNFPKSDEIGPPRPMERGPWDGRVTAFIGCFKAVSMRDTLSLNNARGPSSPCTLHPIAPRFLLDCSSPSLSLSLSLSLSFSLSLSTHGIPYSPYARGFSRRRGRLRMCARQKLRHEIRRNAPPPICGPKPFRLVGGSERGERGGDAKEGENCATVRQESRFSSAKEEGRGDDDTIIRDTAYGILRIIRNNAA